MDLRRPRLQEWIAGAIGVVLIASMFLDWYGGASGARNGWEAFGALDVLLAAVGLMAVALLVLTVAHRAQAVPVAIGSLLVLVGLVASLWLAIRVAAPPDVGRGDTDREAGAWIGLACCLGAALSALWSIRDQRFPGAVRDAARVDVTPLPAPPREGAGRT